MKNIAKIIPVLLILLLSVGSCKKYEEYPPEPTISYLDFVVLRDAQGIDQRGVLKFSYTDGDGNIGLYPHDTMPPYEYNLFIKYFELQNGIFEEVLLINSYYNEDTVLVHDTATFNGRIPILTPAGKNKAIRGEVEDTLFINNPLSQFDTIKFDVYIEDRDFNKSNVISTPPILLKKF